MIAATMLLDASQGLVVAPMAARSVARTVDPSMGVGLVYSTTTGNTETVAGYIAEATGLEMTDIADLSGEDVAGFDGIIVGAPTWHTGADTDQSGYGDNFCDAMDELKSCFSAQGAEVVGSWSTDGYDHMESKSVEGDKFVGLACDEDNQPDQSEERVKA